MVRPILKEPSPVLRAKAKPVNPEELETPEFKTLIKDMIETLVSAKGVGLAAPQIGVSKQVIAVMPPGKDTVILVNPEVVSRSLRRVDSEEGCLSVPGTFGWLKRSASVKIKGLTPDGKQFRRDAKDFEAIIFQHEIDHLNGILFIDKAVSLEKIGVKK